MCANSFTFTAPPAPPTRGPFNNRPKREDLRGYVLLGGSSYGIQLKPVLDEVGRQTGTRFDFTSRYVTLPIGQLPDKLGLTGLQLRRMLIDVVMLILSRHGAKSEGGATIDWQQNQPGVNANYVERVHYCVPLPARSNDGFAFLDVDGLFTPNGNDNIRPDFRDDLYIRIGAAKLLLHPEPKSLKVGATVIIIDHQPPAISLELPIVVQSQIGHGVPIPGASLEIPAMPEAADEAVPALTINTNEQVTDQPFTI